MKLRIMVLLGLVTSFGLISCGTKTEETKKEENALVAQADVYQCPMQCEGDKTYDKEGKCPVCEMDLKKVEEAHHEHVEGEVHEH